MRRTHLLLILIIVIFIASRGGLIFFGYSHISHPYFDEPVSGTLTFDLLQGSLRVPLMAYQYEQRSGDMMIEALLMYPLAAVFGHSMVTIKLCALLCSLLCLLGWVYCIKRYCGMTAALLFAALFALPPPMFARLSLVGTFSSHYMINLLLIVQLICFFRMFEKDVKHVPLLLWCVFGLCAGLGAYSFYSYLIFNAFCVLFVLCRKPTMISLRGFCALCAGGVIGFLPWLWRSVFYSSGGGNFLVDILKNISIAPWKFAQTFLYTVPYTLGYGYPARDIGWEGIILSLFFLVLLVVVVRAAVCFPQTIRTFSSRMRCVDAGLPVEFCFFIALFPLFFLVCMTLSPMQVRPFEYWPTIGLFATFAPADVIRSRWVTIIFPFYFALAALGLYIISKQKARVLQTCAWSAFIVVILFNAVYLTGLFSRGDVHKIFLYKGYNFDQYASRLLMPSRGSSQLKHAEAIVAGYPEENRDEACRALGTRLAFDALARDDAQVYLINYFERVPEEWRDPLMCGLIRILHSMPEQAGDPWVLALAARYPGIFYKNWGYQFLGYTYYGFLLNRTRLFESLSASERFFFKDFLDDFRTGRNDEYNRQFVDRVSSYDEHMVEKMFMHDIEIIPVAFQGLTVQGIGRLVGAEMLFDTLHTLDYPLDSAIGKKFNDELGRYFYRGVGNGFAETLCRYWRRLMPPAAVDCAMYAQGLDIEWQRCISLMQQMPAERQSLIWEGFLRELEQRSLNENIGTFVARKLSMR